MQPFSSQTITCLSGLSFWSIFSLKKNLKSLSLSLSLEEIEIFDSERKKRETRRRFARARERAVQKKVRKGRGGRAVFQNAFKRDFFLKKKRENARPRKKFEFWGGRFPRRDAGRETFQISARGYGITWKRKIVRRVFVSDLESSSSLLFFFLFLAPRV